VKGWTCTCGRQKYDCRLLWKHLVQAVPYPPIRFWREEHRRRVLPIYQHPVLDQKVVDHDGNGIESADIDMDHDSDDYIEPSGDITDGDDHIWSGNRKILLGGGGYKDLKKTGKGKVTNSASAVLGKRALSSNSVDEKSHGGPSKKIRTDVEVIDLTMSSSPVPEPMSASPNARSSSPVNYISDDENQVRIASSSQIMHIYEL
jgi:hypothetical protein